MGQTHVSGFHPRDRSGRYHGRLEVGNSHYKQLPMIITVVDAFLAVGVAACDPSEGTRSFARCLTEWFP